MKKLFLFVALAGSIAFSSCSKDQDDTDAIVGTWLSESSITPDGSSTTTYKDEWLFRLDLTGQYKEMTNGKVNGETAFSWVKSENGYIVNYVDDGYPDETFIIGEQLGKITLEEDGYIVAIKE